jgi:hypothetical protein
MKERIEKVSLVKCTGCGLLDMCIQMEGKEEYYCKPCFDERKLSYDDVVYVVDG